MPGNRPTSERCRSDVCTRPHDNRPLLVQPVKRGSQPMTTKTRLPAPKQLLLVKMSEEEVAEMIERHIEYYVETADGYRSVHLPSKFVRHYIKRDDGALPIA